MRWYHHTRTHAQNGTYTKQQWYTRVNHGIAHSVFCFSILHNMTDPGFSQWHVLFACWLLVSFWFTAKHCSHRPYENYWNAVGAVQSDVSVSYLLARIYGRLITRHLSWILHTNENGPVQKIAALSLFVVYHFIFSLISSLRICVSILNIQWLRKNIIKIVQFWICWRKIMCARIIYSFTRARFHIEYWVGSQMSLAGTVNIIENSASWRQFDTIAAKSEYFGKPIYVLLFVISVQRKNEIINNEFQLKSREVLRHWRRNGFKFRHTFRRSPFLFVIWGSRSHPLLVCAGFLCRFRRDILCYCRLHHFCPVVRLL